MSRLFPRYPKTLHLEGSRVPAGEVNTKATPFIAVEGRHFVLEEKMDGIHTGICFDSEANLVLQWQGSAVDDDADIPGMHEFIQQANAWAGDLLDVLEDRYVLYGEWLAAKQTIFYDALPTFFLEEDIYDRTTGKFLATDERMAIVAKLPEPFRHSVPTLKQGRFESLEEITSAVGVSKFKTPAWRIRFAESCQRVGLDPMNAMFGTDESDFMEGLYIKVEENGIVTARYKWVRYDFAQAHLHTGSQWQALVRNEAAA